MRRLATALVLLPLLGACGGSADPAPLAAAAAGEPLPVVTTPGAAVPQAPEAAAPGLPGAPRQPTDGQAADEPAPEDLELPPGDPGPDAPSVPEPTAGPTVEEPGLKTSVPRAALLPAADLGSGWTALPAGTGSAGPGSACTPRPSGPSAAALLRAPGGGTLRETVSVARDALAEVAGWRAALASCGYAVAPLALGEDGLSARHPGRQDRVLVTTSEQVVVALRATGALADDGGLEDLADLALGSSCPAAPDGCH